MNLFTKGILAFLLLTTVAAKAQDPHFSQYYLSPLTLNPALTGDMDGDYRVGAIYRNQYGSVTVPYVTPSVFADGDLFKNSKHHDYLGIGALLLDDQAGDGDLSNLTLMLSLAYHQALDEDGFWHISLGMQGGYVQKSYNLSALYFPDQYNTFLNTFSLPLTDPIQSQSTHYWDFAAGMDVSGSPSQNSLVTIGVGVFHITQPVETFFDNSNPGIVNRKYVAHASATFGIGNKLYLFPSAVYLLQQPNQELTAGSALGFNFSQNPGEVGTIFYVGCYDRITGNDAIIPTCGFIIHGLQVGFAYDVNTSTLTAASNGKGAYEIGLVYMGDIKTPKHAKKYYCPRFY